MRSSYKLSKELTGEIREYFEGQQHESIKLLLSSVRSRMRSILATDMNCHPNLLFIYNHFLKLKEGIEQHIFRKEQFLFPFPGELANGGEAQLANSMVVNNFLSVFGAENARIAGMVRSLSEASDCFKTEESALADLKRSFEELNKLSSILSAMIEKENAIFLCIKQSHKEQIIYKERRA